MSESSAATSSSIPSPTSRIGAFATTHWSLVLSAGSNADGPNIALERLCQMYWSPLYNYVRRRGYSQADAQDLTQEFFSRLLARPWVGNADPNKGRFRSFLLGAMNHFLSDEWDKARAQKRGGGQPVLSLEFDIAESRYAHEPADHATPEQIFERRWALILMERVLNQLRKEYDDEGRSDLFKLLTPCLLGSRTEQPYAELARKLEVSEGTVKSAVHRLRVRYRHLLREEIASTVASPDEVEDELRHMFMVLGRR